VKVNVCPYFPPALLDLDLAAEVVALNDIQRLRMADRLDRWANQLRFWVAAKSASGKVCPELTAAVKDGVESEGLAKFFPLHSNN
jgi:hypothetical protein